MSYLISKKSFANVIAFALAIFSLYLFLYGGFYNIDSVLITGVGLLVSTMFIFTDFIQFLEKEVVDFMPAKIFLGIVFLLLTPLSGAFCFAMAITSNSTIGASILTPIFFILLIFLGKVLKKKDFKIM